MCGRVLIRYDILFHHSHYQVAKAVRHYPISGVYTGIFALYLQYYTSRKDASKGNNIIFYALCLLYLLSFSLNVLDFLVQVSEDGHLV